MTDQNQLGDQPIEEAYREKMNILGRFLDEFLNGRGTKPEDKKVGFCLMVFPFEGFDGRCNYISTAKRDDVRILLKEQLKRFEGQPEIVGRA